MWYHLRQPQLIGQLLPQQNFFGPTRHIVKVSFEMCLYTVHIIIYPLSNISNIISFSYSFGKAEDFEWMAKSK